MPRVLSCLFVVLYCTVEVRAAEPSPKPNVLFIAIDDLNHWVGHLGRNRQTKTPHLDRLAAMGVSFRRAYCAAPVCNPSRAALMSGRRPGTTGVYDNGQDWKPVIPPSETLTTQFLKAGYHVRGAGKIYHADAHRDAEWSEYLDKRAVRKTTKRGETPHPDSKDDGVGGIKFRPLTEDSRLPDADSVDYGVEWLEQAHDKPWFLAIGLHKPHMPWNVPRSYYDRFPLDSIELPPTLKGDLDDVPKGGLKMAKPDGDHADMLASGRWKEAVQAYLAAIAYCDDEVGRLVSAWEASPERGRTVVVLWGDHGWHLGEKEHWRKFALWEEATRMPYLWVAPGLTDSLSTRVCDQPVDLMSVYPTLCELCGLPRPHHVEGHSVVPLLKDPAAAWPHPALTTFHRGNHGIRTRRWRYIHYADGSEELYDHERDEYEWKNLALLPEGGTPLEELRRLLPEKNAPELPGGGK